MTEWALVEISKCLHGNQNLFSSKPGRCNIKRSWVVELWSGLQNALPVCFQGGQRYAWSFIAIVLASDLYFLPINLFNDAEAWWCWSVPASLMFSVLPWSWQWTFAVACKWRPCSAFLKSLLLMSVCWHLNWEFTRHQRPHLFVGLQSHMQFWSNFNKPHNTSHFSHSIILGSYGMCVWYLSKNPRCNRKKDNFCM